MKAVREALAQDPAFVTVIQEILLEPDSNGKPAPDRASVSHVPDVRNYERMIHAMLENGNERLAIRHLCRMTMINRGSVNNVLYAGGHRHLFEEQEISPSRIIQRVNPKAATMPGLPESCLPLIRALYPNAGEPADAVKEEVAATRPDVIPIRTVPTEDTPKVMPKPKYGPAQAK